MNLVDNQYNIQGASEIIPDDENIDDINRKMLYTDIEEDIRMDSPSQSNCISADDLKQHNELKDQLKRAQSVLASMTPENAKDKVTGKSRTLKVNIVNDEQLKALGDKAFVMKSNEEVELREVTKKNPATGDEIEKLFLVHKVEPIHDTLFKISYHYKVAIKTIQYDNQFSGDDIFYMKELLIEYKGQQVVIREEDLNKMKSPEPAQEPESQKLTTWMRLHNKDVIKRGILKDGFVTDQDTNWDQQAQYYLELHNGDKNKAFDAWKETIPIDMAKVLERGALLSGCKKTGRKDGRADMPDGVNYKFNYDGSTYQGPKRGDRDPTLEKRNKNKCVIF